MIPTGYYDADIKKAGLSARLLNDAAMLAYAYFSSSRTVCDFEFACASIDVAARVRIW